MLQACCVKVDDSVVCQVLVLEDLRRFEAACSCLDERDASAGRWGSDQVVVGLQLRHLDDDMPDDMILLHERAVVDDVDLHSSRLHVVT